MRFELKRFIATAGGIGYLPLAPGTWASLLTASAWFIIFKTLHGSDALQLVILPILLFVGLYCSGKLITEKDKDPSHIVIDEVAGMWMTLLLIPPTYQNVIAGFVLFRFFDILKPFWIKEIEKIHGGWGIMLDDILAGIYGNIILRILILNIIW